MDSTRPPDGNHGQHFRPIGSHPVPNGTAVWCKCKTTPGCRIPRCRDRLRGHPPAKPGTNTRWQQCTSNKRSHKHSPTRHTTRPMGRTLREKSPPSSNGVSSCRACPFKFCSKCLGASGSTMCDCRARLWKSGQSRSKMANSTQVNPVLGQRYE